MTAEEIEKVSQVIAIETEGYEKIRKRIDEGIKEFNEKIKADPSILTKNNIFEEWKPEADEELIQAVYEMFFKSWLLGMSHNARIKPSSDFADVNISFDFGMTYEEVMEYAGGRIALTPAQFRKLSDDMKMHAFTVGRLSQLDMIEKVQRLYLKELGSSDLSVDDFLSSVFEIDGERAGFAGYYTTVFRTNMQKDYNAGKAQQMMEDPPMYLEFIGIDDDRQSEICHVRNGVIRPYTDPWWDDNWPPLHYNCRSTVREIFAEEAGEMKIKPTPLPNIEASDRTIENAEGNKTVIKRNTPVSGFGRNPAKDNAFWASTISQQDRIARYLIQEELNGVAGRTIASDFSSAKKGYTDVSVSSGGVRYQNGLEKETEFKNNLETARVLAESEGYYVELRKAKDLKNNPQWDAWLNGMDKIEFKNPTTITRRGMENAVLDGYKQAQSVAVTLIKDEQIDALLEMIETNMERTRRARSVKQLFVIKNGKVVTLSNAVLKDASICRSLLDSLRTS